MATEPVEDTYREQNKMVAPLKQNVSSLSRLIFNGIKQKPKCCCKRKHTKTYHQTDTSQVKSQWKSRRLRWSALSLGTGSLLYLGYRKTRIKSDEVRLAKNWQITLYRKMPLKAMSRAWGKFNKLDLPVLLRRPLLGLYVWMFGCKLEEASDEELRNYRNLGEFFRRTLKPHVREIDEKHPLTSPADGRILHHGVVKDGILEQVKGVVYSLRGFLGPMSWKDSPEDIKSMTDQEYSEKMNIKPGNKLYHCVIYLAPGDYHRFHSASDWIVKYRRHFPGELLSVNPGVARWIEGLFNFNERVVYTGTWKHGFFSYTAVGATNVGSIKIYQDQDLSTNNGIKHSDGAYHDKCLTDNDNIGIHINKGEMFGEFNLGSTIVLIFEAPDNFKFSVKGGQKVKFGEAMGMCN